jgi:hypothetical protein
MDLAETLMPAEGTMKANTVLLWVTESFKSSIRFVVATVVL